MKVCSKCKIKKDLKCFSKYSNIKSGYNSHCKECEKQRRQSYKKKNACIVSDPNILKTCPKCNTSKPQTDFSKDLYQADGHHSHCKECNKQQKESNKKKNAGIVSDPNISKICPQCNKSKPQTDFSKDLYQADGHHSHCKECQKQQAQSNKKKNAGIISDPNISKICPKCNTTKPQTAFSKKLSNPDGHYAYCKECDKQQKESNKKKNFGIVSDSNILKTCSKCNTSKPQTDFSKHLSNPDGHQSKCKECESQYEKDNPELSRARRNKRRANKRKLPFSKHWNTVQTYINTHESCLVCGSNKNMSTDHIIAQSIGGGYTPDNAIPLCISCNRKKYKTYYTDWVASFPDHNLRLKLSMYIYKVRNGFWTRFLKLTN